MRICVVEECGKIAKSRGFCGMHYFRFRKYGDALAGAPFRNRTKKLVEVGLGRSEEECLFWPFATTKNGYALIRLNGKNNIVSRLMCEKLNGPAPSPKHQTAHSCGNGTKGCISGNHLRWATVKENNYDKIAHGTFLRGEDQTSTKLTEKEVIEIRRIAGSMRQEDIGAMYGVSQSTISMIVNRLHWGWLN
jgi:hypothetical protein